MTLSPGRRAATIVCPELPAPAWERIQQALEKIPELTLLRCPAVAAEVLAVCARLEPAILIADIDLVRQFNSEELLERSRSGRLQVIALIADPRNTDHISLLRAGCAGVLDAAASAEMYQKAIQGVSEGEMWAPRLVVSQLARETLLADNPRRLTHREREILGFLGRNLTNQQIADQLFISRETVRWHLRSLYSKIGVSNRPAAVEYARRSTSQA